MPSRFFFEIAKDSDDPSLQTLIRNHPMVGDIEIAFQRDPSYFDALKVQGKFNQVIVGRERVSNKIVVCGTRSIKPLYINGQVCYVGYLSNLRMEKNYRGNILLAHGYRFFQRLHQDAKTPIYIMTIVETNEYARRILTSARAGIPKSYDKGCYCSFALIISKRKKENKEEGVKIVRGSIELIDKIIKCLHRNGPNKQFYPYYKKEEFHSSNGLLKGFHISDFYVAIKNGKIVGTIAKWDQRSFKQVIIVSYKGKIKIVKPLFNLYSKIVNSPPLPSPGSQLNFFFIGLIAIDSNDPRIFSALLRRLYNDSVGQPYAYCLIGLHARDPLIRALNEYHTIKYNSRLYVVSWEDGEDFYKTIDNRIPYLEIGSL